VETDFRWADLVSGNLKEERVGTTSIASYHVGSSEMSRFPGSVLILNFVNLGEIWTYRKH